MGGSDSVERKRFVTRLKRERDDKKGSVNSLSQRRSTLHIKWYDRLDLDPWVVNRVRISREQTSRRDAVEWVVLLEFHSRVLYKLTTTIAESMIRMNSMASASFNDRLRVTKQIEQVLTLSITVVQAIESKKI